MVIPDMLANAATKLKGFVKMSKPAPTAMPALTGQEQEAIAARFPELIRQAVALKARVAKSAGSLDPFTLISMACARHPELARADALGRLSADFDELSTALSEATEAVATEAKVYSEKRKVVLVAVMNRLIWLTQQVAVVDRIMTDAEAADEKARTTLMQPDWMHGGKNMSWPQALEAVPRRNFDTLLANKASHLSEIASLEAFDTSRHDADLPNGFIDAAEHLAKVPGFDYRAAVKQAA